MKRYLPVLLFIGVLGLGVYTVFLGSGSRPRNPAKSIGDTDSWKRKRDKASMALKAEGIKLPDTSGWKHLETKGGLFSIPVPPGWEAIEQRDLVNRREAGTGFMVSKSLKDTSEAVIWYPFLPLFSSSSGEIRELLERAGSNRPRKIGLIMYDHPVVGPVLRRMQWPFLPVCSPLEVFKALENEWFGRYFWEKHAVPKPKGFKLENPHEVWKRLGVAKVSFLLGSERYGYKEVEGLCFLGTSRPAPGRGGWGVFLLLLQAPKGKWNKVLPTMIAILRGIEYNPGKHLETIGKERIAEVELTKRMVEMIPNLDFKMISSQVGLGE